MIHIEVEDGRVREALNELVRRSADLSPAMDSIATELLSLTERAFETEGPGWEPLAQATILQREKIDKWPGQILQVTNALARSVTTDSGPDFAEIGANTPYAAIHQFGGQAGRGRKTTIPARPYLPIGADGDLTDEAADAVLDIVEFYLQGAL